MKGMLVIVPCGVAKIWDRHPERGAVAARDAYTGAPFTVNRRYAEHFGERWLILSAKYGFISPDYMIPGPYEVSFKHRATQPVTLEVLRQQARKQRLGRFAHIIGLGGVQYRRMIQGAFDGLSVKLHFPFRGLRVGEGMAAINEAVRLGEPV